MLCKPTHYIFSYRVEYCYVCGCVFMCVCALVYFRVSAFSRVCPHLGLGGDRVPVPPTQGEFPTADPGQDLLGGVVWAVCKRSEPGESEKEGIEYRRERARERERERERDTNIYTSGKVIEPPSGSYFKRTDTHSQTETNPSACLHDTHTHTHKDRHTHTDRRTL